MFYLTKSTKFDAAHFLPNYVGKCSSMHGHTWRVDVTICGEELAGTGPNTGMIVDFNHLKVWLQHIIDERFDHKVLNEEVFNPTAENLAFDIYYELTRLWKTAEHPFSLHSVKVYEGDSAWVEYKED